MLGGFALCAFLTWVERDADREPFDPSSYARVLRALREAYDGILALVYFATIAGASIAGLLVVVGTRMRAHWLPQMSSTIRDQVLNAWWRISFIPLGLVFGFLFACDVWLWAFGKSRPVSVSSLTRGFEPFEELLAKLFPSADEPALPQYEWWVSLVLIAPLMLLAVPAVAFEAWHETGHTTLFAVLLAVPAGVAFFLAMGLVGDLLRHRAPGLALGGAVVGFVLCFFYYPALANQLSPKEVFESYRRLCPGARRWRCSASAGARRPTTRAGSRRRSPIRAEPIDWLVARACAAALPGAEGRGAPEAQQALARARRARVRTCRSSTPGRVRSCSRRPP